MIGTAVSIAISIASKFLSGVNSFPRITDNNVVRITDNNIERIID